MRIILTVLLMLALLTAPAVLADEILEELDDESLEQISDATITDDEIEQASAELADDDPGALPDDGIAYTFKRFGENVGLAFTFNERAKAQKELQIARIRLLEARKAALEGRDEALESATADYEALTQRARARLSDDEQGLRDAVALRERVRDHEVIAAEIRARLEESGLEGEELEHALEHIGELAQRQDEIRAEVEARKLEIKVRVKERRNITDDELDDIEEEAEAAAEEGRDGQVVSAEAFIAIVERHIARLQERLDNAQGEHPDAQAAIELATELVEKAKAALEEGDTNAAKSLMLEARRALVAPEAKVRIRAVIDTNETRVEIRERVREELDKRRELLVEIREKRQEEAEEFRGRVRELVRDEDGGIDALLERRAEIRKDADEARTEIRERMRDANTEIRTRVREVTRDGVTTTQVERRVRALADAAEEDEKESESDDNSGSDDTDSGDAQKSSDDSAGTESSSGSESDSSGSDADNSDRG